MKTYFVNYSTTYIHPTNSKFFIYNQTLKLSTTIDKGQYRIMNNIHKLLFVNLTVFNMESAIIISLFALVIAFLGFFFQDFHKGKLVFAEPHIYYLCKRESEFFITIPIIIKST